MALAKMMIKSQYLSNFLRKSILIIILIAGVAGVILFSQDEKNKPNITLSPSKEIIVNDLSLREIWRWSGLMTGGSGDPPKILIKGDFTILAIKDTSLGDYDQRVIALNIQTGEMVWASKPTFERPSSLYADNEQVYVGYNNRAEALDIKTGKRLWVGAQQPERKKGTLHLYARNEQIEVYDIDTKDFPLNTKLWLLDSQTGETLEIVEVPTIFFQDADKYYLSNYIMGSFGAGLIARDKTTNTELWQLHTTGLVRCWPIIIGGMMYLDAGDVYAVNTDNGEIWWSYEDADIINPDTGNVDERYENLLIPRIAYGRNVLYFVKSNSSIVGLNSITGEVVGTVEISPPPTYYDDEGRFQDTYYLITASDKYVAAYYGDSQELIVFERTDVEP